MESEELSMTQKARGARWRFCAKKCIGVLDPTLAAEYLAKKHKIQVGRETLRGWMVEAKLWQAKKKRVEKIHIWRQRRSR